VSQLAQRGNGVEQTGSDTPTGETTSTPGVASPRSDPPAPGPGVNGGQRHAAGRAVRADLDAVDDPVLRALSRRAPSVPRLFADRVAESADAEAFRYRRGGGWTSVTWQETAQRVRRLAAGLIEAGVTTGDRVALVCSTRYEWIVADLAIMSAGAACTSVFPTTGIEDSAYILADSGSRLAIVENVELLNKLASARDRLPDLEQVLVIDVPPGGGAGRDDWAQALDTVEDRGAARLAREPDVVDRVIAGLGPDDLAALLYTSGTTGRPKGVRLVHDCWTYQAAAIAARELLSPRDVQFLWLPLAHSFGNVLLAAQLAVGFVTAVDGQVERLVENMAVQKPTFVGAAPRIFEKARARIVEAATATTLKRRIFESAFSVGRQVFDAERAGRRVSPVLRARHAIADRLVFAKIRERFGGRLRFFISGAARLDPALGEWFAVAGIIVLEGYGLTETSGAIFVNLPWRHEFGRVGSVFPGCEVRIADDGEVLLRGPSVMHGYHGSTDVALSASDEQDSGMRGLRPDGWLATGDIGNLRDGFLEITDRKKDLIKTSNGKYVAPQKVENMLTAQSSTIATAMVVGDGRSYCAALIALDPDEAAAWATRAGLGELPYAELVATEQTQKLIADAVEAVNARLSSWETIKRFRLLPDMPTEDNGLLTATMKLRRAKAAERYADQIDALYR